MQNFEIGYYSVYPTPVPGPIQGVVEEKPIPPKSESTLLNLFYTAISPLTCAIDFLDYWVCRTILTVPILPMALISFVCNTLPCFFYFPTIEDVCDDLYNTNDLIAVPLRLTTSDHAVVEAIQINAPFQQHTPPREQKWIVVAMPNGAAAQHMADMYASLAEKHGINALLVNYRGVGASLLQAWPSGYDDLIEDVDTGVRYLLDNGVKEENVVLEGLSLGGATVTKVAEKHKAASLIAFNTFSSLKKEAKEMISSTFSNLHNLSTMLSTDVWSSDPHPPTNGMIAIYTLLEAGVGRVGYIMYYALSILENLISLDIPSAVEDLSALGRALICFPAGTLLSIITVVCVVAEMALFYICSFDSCFVSHYPIRAARTLLDRIPAGEENSLLLKLSQSSRIQSIVDWYLDRSRWNTDILKSYNSLTSHRLITYSPRDQVIPYEASLVKAYREQPGVETRGGEIYHLCDEHSSHMTTLHGSDHGAYLRFLEKAFGIRFMSYSRY